ncbi:MAG TPA: radical SAM protein [Pseudomonadales bacterium]|nr:radical SAM protein [Pseudomonadales bacterium]
MMVDICSVCNFKCSFCPTADRQLLKSVGRPKKVMDFQLFKKIIDDLKAFEGNIVVLSLHKDGEPLLNKEVAEMVAYAKKAKVASTIEITTNAALLTQELAMSLIDAELDSIRISVEHVTSDGYKRIVKTYSKYDQIVENVSFLFKEKERRKSPLNIMAKIIDTGLSDDEKRKFHKDFDPISDLARIEGIMGWSHSEMKDFTLGLNPTVGMDGITPLRKDRVVCPEPFKLMAVNSNGAVSPCCDDWAHSLILGDLNHESAQEVWQGKELARIRRLHLENRRGELPACSNCQYMQGVTELFDLDESRTSLLKKYEMG